MTERMKILIADSGSTKTDWALVEGGGVRRLTTAGLNPVHRSTGEIEATLRAEFTLPAEGLAAVFFYGAGCLPALCEVMEGVLRRVFKAGQVTVGSDLLGAARALLGHRAGVACILGTGSNSALWDGERIAAHVPPLGYILGDEGSGADLGKRLVAARFKGLLPSEVAEAFDRRYPTTEAEIVEAVYRRPGGGRFLAGFAPFLSEHLDRPATRAIVEAAFTDFFERNLLQYNDIRHLPVAFTGSVASALEEPLRAVLGRHGLTVGRVERAPMDGLVAYHTTTP